jgi:hypothetical protein
MQAFTEEHDTPSSSLPLAPERGFGVLRIVQVLPFHASASVLDLADSLTW